MHGTTQARQLVVVVVNSPMQAELEAVMRAVPSRFSRAVAAAHCKVGGDYRETLLWVDASRPGWLREAD